MECSVIEHITSKLPQGDFLTALINRSINSAVYFAFFGDIALPMLRLPRLDAADVLVDTSSIFQTFAFPSSLDSIKLSLMVSSSLREKSRHWHTNENIGSQSAYLVSALFIINWSHSIRLDDTILAMV